MRYFWTNKRTTIPALVAGVANLISLFGVPVPAGMVEGINVIALILIGFFAKDANVTGGTVVQ